MKEVEVLLIFNNDNYSFINLLTGEVYQAINGTYKTHTGAYLFSETNIVKSKKVCKALKEAAIKNDDYVDTAWLYKLKNNIYLWEY